jgi:hypothetical protein
MEIDQEVGRRQRGDQTGTRPEPSPPSPGENLDDVAAGTTEYAANSEAADGGPGYVEGEDLPTQGRDDAPQG